MQKLPLAATLVLGLVAAVAASAAEPHRYVGVRKCATCHKKELIGNQVAAWRELPHARAYATLESERSRAIAANLSLTAPPAQAPECLRCHVTAHGAPPSRFAYQLDPTDGVQCESCHGPGRDFRKKKIMSDRKKALAKGLWPADEDPAICITCHNPQSPTWDPERFTLDDGRSVGFDFELGKKRIAHPIPEDVKGNYLELEEEQKRREKEREAGG